MATTNEKKAPRITKAMKFEAIKALLDGKKPALEDFSRAEAHEFIDSELKLLAKKNKANPEKMTAAQQRDEELKKKIFDFISTKPADIIGYTCTQIMIGVEDIPSTQKVVPLVRQLLLAGLLDSTEVKGRSYWHLPENQEMTLDIDEDIA